MTMEEVITTREQLNRELRMALSTMERSDRVFDIKKKIIENQAHCPHFSDKYNWAIIDDTCPYCGLHFATGGISNAGVEKEWN